MCDMACVRRTDGSLFVKSSDRPFDEPQLLRWFGPRPAGGDVETTYIRLPRDPGAAAFVGSQPTWLWGVEHGVNQHRVAVGNERIWTVDDARAAPPGLIGMDLVRLALERGRSADEAVEDPLVFPFAEEPRIGVQRREQTHPESLLIAS